MLWEKVEIAHNEQFLLFPQSFQKNCTADKKQGACLGKGSRIIGQHGSLTLSP